MALFALRRLLLSIPLLVGITFVSYMVISLAPGGPLDFLTPEDPNASPEVKERLIKEFGLDRPIHVQYWQWLKRAVRLDFGRSFLGVNVVVNIAEDSLYMPGSYTFTRESEKLLLKLESLLRAGELKGKRNCPPQAGIRVRDL